MDFCPHDRSLSRIFPLRRSDSNTTFPLRPLSANSSHQKIPRIFAKWKKWRLRGSNGGPSIWRSDWLTVGPLGQPTFAVCVHDAWHVSTQIHHKTRVSCHILTVQFSFCFKIWGCHTFFDASNRQIVPRNNQTFWPISVRSSSSSSSSSEAQ